MSEPVIIARELGKRYRVGSGLAVHDTLRDTIAGVGARLAAALPWTGNAGNSGAGKENQGHLWALKDVSLEVWEGEVVGIIGRNGAGKTTLLKVLSRVTPPSEGYAQIRGRVGSLLEVGTGFHQELTGRENVYLSGAVLGMSRREIDRKFDEIIAFAETERYLDTPIKRYSTGMSMRLAFAVAAHLEPEVLLVDEVLAVGDLAFQKRCLGKMSEAAGGGRTILFVSHQMHQIRRLCERVLWIDGGRVRMEGEPAVVVGAYESAMQEGREAATHRPGASRAAVSFRRWEIGGAPSEQGNVLDHGGSVTFKFMLDVTQELRGAVHGAVLLDGDGRVAWSNSLSGLDLKPGTCELAHTLPHLPLRPGPYQWMVSVGTVHGTIDEWYCAPELLVATEPATHLSDRWTGFLNIPADFEIRKRT